MQINKQKAKQVHDSALELVLRGVAASIIILPIVAIIIEAEPDQVAEASPPPSIEGAYSPPPKTQKESPDPAPSTEQSQETPTPAKPFLTDEVKAQMAERINAFSVEVGSPLGDKHGMAWVEAGIRVNRHPYSLVAIALADSSLGRNLTTPYNLGNVGNTDSCPTCQAFSSWQEGIDAIANTLVNRYLGKATKLCHLSRGGWNNCPEGSKINGGKFYASSVENWNRNAVWAESWLHGTEWRTDHSIILSDYYQLNVG